MSIVSLGEVATINPTQPKGSSIEDRYAFLPMAAVDADALEAAPSETLSASEVKPGLTYFEDGDVLVAKITPCFENGKIALVTSSGLSGFGSTEFHVVRPTERLDRRYAAHFLRQQDVRRRGEKRMTGSAGQKRVPRKFLEELQIPLPPLAEQKRIAAILDQADELRRKRQRAIDRLNQLGQAIFHEMFGDPFAAARVWHEKDDLRQAGWRRCALGDQITLQRGKDITSKEASAGQIPVISSGGISYYHDVPFAKGPGVLLGRKGSVGKVHYSEGDYWPHDTTLYVKEFNDNLPLYVYYFFNQFPIGDFEASIANPSLNRNNLHPVIVLWPPIPLQAQFVERMEATNRIYSQQYLSSNCLDVLFTSLQHRAFQREL